MKDGDELSFSLLCSFLAAMVSLARHFSRCLIDSDLLDIKRGDMRGLTTMSAVKPVGFLSLSKCGVCVIFIHMVLIERSRFNHGSRGIPKVIFVIFCW